MALKMVRDTHTAIRTRKRALIALFPNIGAIAKNEPVLTITNKKASRVGVDIVKSILRYLT